jgi:tRNA 2-selenouridine synthase
MTKKKETEKLCVLYAYVFQKNNVFIKTYMKVEKIHPADLWQHLTDRVLIDVRSPAEFARAHIPNAHSLPLFNDEERAKVGTMYKQMSPEAALLKGLEIVGPKMSGFVKKAIKWSPDRKVIVHCWRGGKRSGSVAWLLKFAGFDVLTIEGGYKNYRQTVLQSFDNQLLKNMIILGGKTGSGKTYILKELEKRGEQIIDLEGLANHKGSAFGWIGENQQPTTEHFENLLHDALRMKAVKLGLLLFLKVFGINLKMHRLSISKCRLSYGSNI